MRGTLARLRNIVTALAVVILGLVVLAGPSTATGGPDSTSPAGAAAKHAGSDSPDDCPSSGPSLTGGQHGSSGDPDCDEPEDECPGLHGHQPPGFPCDMDPKHGQDPWEGEPNCYQLSVATGYVPWTQAWTFEPDGYRGAGEWKLGEKEYGDPVVTGHRTATEAECPPPPDPCPSLAGVQSQGFPCSMQPEPVTDSMEGCVLPDGLGSGRATREGLREYVLVDGEWVLEPMADVAWGEWEVVPYSDEEYLGKCAGDQPPDEVRQLSGFDESCELGGVELWSETRTTPYVWDAAEGEWVPGTETVSRSESFQPYGDAKYERLCEPDVAGEQEDRDPPRAPEVKGVQAVVPTAVDAGIGSTGEPLSGRDPLWLLAIGGGVALMGFAGLRRRAAVGR